MDGVPFQLQGKEKTEYNIHLLTATTHAPARYPGVAERGREGEELHHRLDNGIGEGYGVPGPTLQRCAQ